MGHSAPASYTDRPTTPPPQALAFQTDPHPWGPTHLDQHSQDIIDGDPSKGPFILPSQDLSTPKIQSRLAQHPGDSSKDVPCLRAVLLAGQRGSEPS